MPNPAPKRCNKRRLIAVGSSKAALLRENLPPNLALLDPGSYSHQYQDTGHNDSPQLDVQHVRVEVRLSSSTDCNQRHQKDEISTPSMVFVDRLAFIDAAEHLLRDIELSEAHQSLAEYQDVHDEAHYGVCTFESSFWVACFVHLNDYQPSYESHDSNQVQCKVHMRPCHFLLLGVGWL